MKLQFREITTCDTPSLDCLIPTLRTTCRSLVGPTEIMAAKRRPNGSSSIGTSALIHVSGLALEAAVAMGRDRNRTLGLGLAERVPAAGAQQKSCAAAASSSSAAAAVLQVSDLL